jgi:hypothetical protein
MAQHQLRKAVAKTSRVAVEYAADLVDEHSRTVDVVQIDRKRNDSMGFDANSELSSDRQHRDALSHPALADKCDLLHLINRRDDGGDLPRPPRRGIVSHVLPQMSIGPWEGLPVGNPVAAKARLDLADQALGVPFDQRWQGCHERLAASERSLQFQVLDQERGGGKRRQPRYLRRRQFVPLAERLHAVTTQEFLQHIRTLLLAAVQLTERSFHG